LNDRHRIITLGERQTAGNGRKQSVWKWKKAECAGNKAGCVGKKAECVVKKAGCVDKNAEWVGDRAKCTGEKADEKTLRMAENV
jgi:hypothetical protein